MEEPFTILPMQAFCDKIYNWCVEIVSWTPGDNDMFVAEPRPQDMQLSMAPDKSTPLDVKSEPVAAVNGDVNGTTERRRLRDRIREFYQPVNGE